MTNHHLCKASPTETASSLRWLRESWRPTLCLAPESAVSRTKNNKQNKNSRLWTASRKWPRGRGQIRRLFGSRLSSLFADFWLENHGKPKSPKGFLASKAAEAKKQAGGWRKGKEEYIKLSSAAVYIYICIHIRVCNSMYLHTGKLKRNPSIDPSSMIQGNFCRLLMILSVDVFLNQYPLKHT